MTPDSMQEYLAAPAGGSTNAAIRIPPDRFAQLVDAKWVDVCKDA